MHPGSFQLDPAFGGQANNSVREILRVRQRGRFRSAPDVPKVQEQVDLAHRDQQLLIEQVRLIHQMKLRRLRRWDQMRQPRQEPLAIGSRWVLCVCVFWYVDIPRCVALHRAKV